MLERRYDELTRQDALLILYVVGAHGNIRFREITKHVESSEPTVSTRLDELEEAGLLERTFYDEMPPRVEYSLTPAAEQIYELLTPIVEWAISEYGTEKIG